MQEREFMRLGGMETIKVDVRIIAATNCDLREMVDDGRFREDLFYRLHVINICLPPLRERKEDIPVLAQHFLEKYSRGERQAGPRADRRRARSADGLRLARQRPRARERHRARRRAQRPGRGSARIWCRSTCDPRPRSTFRRFVVPPEGISFKDVIMSVEKRLIESTLEAAGGVQKRAAELLRIKPTTLNEMIKRYEIGPRRKRPEGFDASPPVRESKDPVPSRTRPAFPVGELTRE